MAHNVPMIRRRRSAIRMGMRLPIQWRGPRTMRFGFHLFMVDPAEFAAIARACDESGWDHLAVGDTPFNPEVVTEPYPYTPDGRRFWPNDDPTLDPWVAVAHMATVTRRLRFIVSVLKLPLRKPLLEAKAACSAAFVANDRLAVGVGLAWHTEDFRFLNENMKTRGARADEAMQILRLCMDGGGAVEFHGKYYDFDRLVMEPHPKQHIPLYVGGLSEAAMRRAARFGDGWLGAMHSIEEIKQIVPAIMRHRREYGRDKEPFDVLLQCPETTTADEIRRLEDLGVTDFWIAPWMFYAAQAEKERLSRGGAIPTLFNAQPSLQVKLDAIRRYGDAMIAKFR